jgi:hypothetical protein
MYRDFRTLLFTAAVSGLFAGTAVSAHAASPAEGSQNQGAQSPASSAHLLYTAGADKHMCKGQNSCKGKGGCAESDNGCRGKNSCKGKGGCSTMGPTKLNFA